MHVIVSFSVMPDEPSLGGGGGGGGGGTGDRTSSDPTKLSLANQLV